MWCHFNQKTISATVNNEFIWMRKYEKKYYVLSCRNEIYFDDYKLPIKIDENWHIGRNIDYEMKRKKAIEPELLNLLELILTKKNLIFLELSIKAILIVVVEHCKRI